MSFQVLTLYGAKRPTFGIATAIPISTTSGALAVPFSCLIASTSCWLVPSGSASLMWMPYFFAAAMSLDIPPPAAAEVTVDQLVPPLEVPGEPDEHAADPAAMSARPDSPTIARRYDDLM